MSLFLGIKDQIFTVPLSLNSWLTRSTPLLGKASKEKHGGRDDGSNGANGKESARTPRDLGKR